MGFPKNKQERELLLKKIYEYCVKVDWEPSKLEEFAKELEITSERVKYLARTYAKKHLSDKEYQQLLQGIADADKKKVDKRNLKLNTINPILLELKGKKTYYLWENDEEKELALNYIYNYCGGLNWQNDKYNELSDKIGFSRDYIKALVKSYAKTHLSPEDYSLFINNMIEDPILKKEKERPLLSIINPILLELTGKETYYLWENDMEEKLVLKYIYDRCDKVNWEFNQIVELSNKLRISTYYVNELIKSYAKNHLSPEDYDLLRQRLVANSKLNKKEGNLKLSIINPILLELTGKETYYLWQNAEEKELVLRYIYEYCEKNIPQRVSFVNFARSIGISESKLQRLRKQYAIEYLKLTEEQYNEQRTIQTNNSLSSFRRNRQSKYKDIFNSLLSVSNLTEIIEILNGEDINSVRSKLSDYVNICHNGNEAIKKILQAKINMYSDYVSRKKQEEMNRERQLEKQKQIPIAIATIREFIDNEEVTVEKFCEDNGISKNKFYEYVDLVAENDFELFGKYDFKISNARKQRFSILINQIKQIVVYLKIGIEEYGVVRNFDLIDYFLFTGISLKNILKIAENVVSKADYILLSRFVNQNMVGINDTPNVINQIMNEKIIVRYEKDKKGNPIPGTVEILTAEEKTKILNFLSQNQIPLNLKTYNLAYRRYINGTLDLAFRKQELRRILERKEDE